MQELNCEMASKTRCHKDATQMWTSKKTESHVDNFALTFHNDEGYSKALEESSVLPKTFFVKKKQKKQKNYFLDLLG